jgi:small-conductance mechanosensitive channel
MSDFAAIPIWPIVLTVGYPLIAVLLSEAARRLGSTAPVAAGVLRQITYVVLPTGAIWLVLRYVAQLPQDNLAVRIAVTAFAISALYVLLRVAQAVLIVIVDEERHAPKLLFDLVRIGLAIGFATFVVSAVWNVNLGSLLAALGVGSVVLGFALQDVAGNFVSGLGLLYQGKFSLGDWIVVEGKVAEVVELDWRSVTLLATSGERIIVANSSLARLNVTIAARKGERLWAEVPLELGIDIPPERVRAAALEVGRAMKGIGTDGIRCRVGG